MVHFRKGNRFLKNLYSSLRSSSYYLAEPDRCRNNKLLPRRGKSRD